MVTRNVASKQINANTIQKNILNMVYTISCVKCQVPSAARYESVKLWDYNKRQRLISLYIAFHADSYHLNDSSSSTEYCTVTEAPEINTR